MIVVGKISVKAILENKKRPIHKVYLLKDKNDKDMRYVKRLAQPFEVVLCDRTELNKITNVTNHGGYAVLCGERISDTLDMSHHRYFCIEGVTDPYNLGEILRTLLALGVQGVITPHYDFFEHEAKLIRASAGASEKIDWIQSNDFISDLEKLKAHGTTLISAHRQEGSTSLITYKWPKKTCVCIGGALRGLSKPVLDLSDVYVRLDYNAKVALSANSATTVFAYAQFQNIKDDQA